MKKKRVKSDADADVAAASAASAGGTPDSPEGAGGGGGKKTKTEKVKEKKLDTFACEDNRSLGVAIQEIADLYFEFGQMGKGGEMSPLLLPLQPLCVLPVASFVVKYLDD